MRLISLSLENFRQHQSTQIQFQTGLFGILGDNGSGKTTILEAIAWALYGKGARGNNDSLIWRLAAGKSAAVVDLVFEFNRQILQVRRFYSASKSGAELIQNHKVVANSTKAVNEKILELLAMNHEEFFNSYFTGQKDLNFLGSVGAAERGRFIAKMLGYEKIIQVQGESSKPGTIRFDLQNQKLNIAKLEGAMGDFDQIKTAIATYQTQLIAAETQLKDATTAQDLAISQKANLEPQLQQQTQKNDQHHRLKAQIQNLQIQTDNLAKILAQKAERRAAFWQNAQTYEALQIEIAGFVQMETEWQMQQISRQEFNQKLELENRLAQLNQELRALDLNLKPLQNLNVAQIQAELSNYKAEQKSIEIQIQAETQARQIHQADLKAKIASAQELKQKLLTQHQIIHNAGSDGVCPTCERALDSEFERVVDSFAEQITNLQTQISLSERDLAALNFLTPEFQILTAKFAQNKAQIQQLQNAELKAVSDAAKRQLWQQQFDQKTSEIHKLQIQAANSSNSFDLAAFNQLEQQLIILKPKYLQYLRLADAVLRLQEIDQELANFEHEQTQVSAQITNLELEIAALGFVEAEYLNLKTKIDVVNRDLENFRNRKNQAQQQQMLIAQSLAAAQTQEIEFRRKQTEYRHAQTEQVLLQEIDSAFTNMRQHFTEEIRPQLADAASIFLNQLTDGRYNAIEIDEKYNVIVLADGDRKPVISGGEEDIVNLCLRLAISQMITERSGQPFSLLILDEVFGSLDDERRNNVLTLLNGLERQFEQVLIISHLDAIKDSLNHAIRLEFNPKTQSSIVAER